MHSPAGVGSAAYGSVTRSIRLGWLFLLPRAGGSPARRPFHRRVGGKQRREMRRIERLLAEPMSAERQLEDHGHAVVIG